MVMANWKNPTTRGEIEAALDAGRLYVQAGSGKFWLARRNGKTQTWKTRPEHFSIPIKYGFRNTARIDHVALVPLASYFRIADSREAAEASE
jgi:hypothetical protein